LRTFVIRNWEIIPPKVRLLHHQYRTRLDMYCVLVFVAGIIALGGGALFLVGNRRSSVIPAGTSDARTTSSEHAGGIGAAHPLAALVTVIVFALFAFICYRAAIVSAQGYVAALASIDDAVGAAKRAPASHPNLG
jgi:hypothetical protein